MARIGRPRRVRNRSESKAWARVRSGRTPTLSRAVSALGISDSAEPTARSFPGPLVEFDLEAGGFQAGGRGEPADAGAGDDDLQGMSAHGRVRSLEVEGSSNAAISAATVST